MNTFALDILLITSSTVCMGNLFAHDGTIEVARIQAHSELVILLLGNHKPVHPGSGLCTFLNDSQLLHSLSSSLRG